MALGPRFALSRCGQNLTLTLICNALNLSPGTRSRTHAVSARQASALLDVMAVSVPVQCHPSGTVTAGEGPSMTPALDVVAGHLVFSNNAASLPRARGYVSYHGRPLFLVILTRY